MAKIPRGAPDFNDTVFLEFSSTTVSGVMSEDETYRVTANADCMVGFGELHDEGFNLSNGSYLKAGEELLIETTANSKYIHVVADILTTSGICTCTKLK